MNLEEETKKIMRNYGIYASKNLGQNFLINNEKYMIEKTIQTIEFKMNNKGGSLKSEAGMEVNKGSISNRIFDFTDDFTLFLKEEDKSLPYFAINIDNIEDFR